MVNGLNPVVSVVGIVWTTLTRTITLYELLYELYLDC